MSTQRKNTYNICRFLILIAFFCLSTYIYAQNTGIFLFILNSTQIFIGFTVFVIAINTYEISQNHYFTFLAISFGFCSLICLGGMVKFFDNPATSFPDGYMKFTILADIVKIFSIIYSYRFIKKTTNIKGIIYKYIVATTLITVFALYIWSLSQQSDSWFISSVTLNVGHNIITCTIAIGYLVYLKKKKVDPTYIKNIAPILITFALHEALFVFYDVSGNKIRILAHIIVIIHQYILYKLIIKDSLKEPYHTLFMDLKERKEALENTNNELRIKNNQLETIKQSLEKGRLIYKSLVEILPDAVIIRRNGKIVFANATSITLLEAKNKEELLGKKIHDIISQDTPTLQNMYSEEGNTFLELRVNTLQGKEFFAEVIELDILFNEKPSTLIIIRDISERKKIYELNSKLERKIEREKIRTEFFANLSHELRTPINVIYSALQLQELHIKEQNNGIMAKYHKIIRQNCLRLLRMCNNLIDITKIDAGFFKASWRCINIVPVIENIVLSVSLFVESKGMNIVFDTNVEESYLTCDEDLIERIILNLISNSVKYGHENQSIWIDIIDKDDIVEVIIKDDGPGIPRDKCEVIFDRFIQMDRSLRRTCEGSGIGLSLVKSLVELHEGHIRLHSDEGKGCKFIIQLPKGQNVNGNEIATTLEPAIHTQRIVEKVDIEFSDIYM